jgi:Domain of Unknown Function (DUF1080)
MYSGRKKRYIIASAVAIPIILGALYSAQQSGTYKNSKVWNFDSYSANTSVSNLFASSDAAVPNGKGYWIIKPDDTAPSKPNVLARISNDATGSAYHLLIIPEGVYDNFEASVKFKILSGTVEQAAGLIIRFQDLNHYFVLRADALNDRFSLCRTQIGAIVCTQDKDVRITKDQWHTMTVRVAAQGIAGDLDGMRLIQRNDQNYLSGGQIGFWAKGDSAVYFDDLKIAY